MVQKWNNFHIYDEVSDMRNDGWKGERGVFKSEDKRKGLENADNRKFCFPILSYSKSSINNNVEKADKHIEKTLLDPQKYYLSSDMLHTRSTNNVVLRKSKRNNHHHRHTQIYACKHHPSIHPHRLSHLSDASSYHKCSNHLSRDCASQINFYPKCHIKKSETVVCDISNDKNSSVEHTTFRNSLTRNDNPSRFETSFSIFNPCYQSLTPPSETKPPFSTSASTTDQSFHQEFLQSVDATVLNACKNSGENKKMRHRKNIEFKKELSSKLIRASTEVVQSKAHNQNERPFFSVSNENFNKAQKSFHSSCSNNQISISNKENNLKNLSYDNRNNNNNNNDKESIRKKDDDKVASKACLRGDLKARKKSVLDDVPPPLPRRNHPSMQCDVAQHSKMEITKSNKDTVLPNKTESNAAFNNNIDTYCNAKTKISKPSETSTKYSSDKKEIVTNRNTSSSNDMKKASTRGKKPNNQKQRNVSNDCCEEDECQDSNLGFVRQWLMKFSNSTNKPSNNENVYWQLEKPTRDVYVTKHIINDTVSNKRIVIEKKPKNSHNAFMICSKSFHDFKKARQKVDFGGGDVQDLHPTSVDDSQLENLLKIEEKNNQEDFPPSFLLSNDNNPPQADGKPTNDNTHYIPSKAVHFKNTIAYQSKPTCKIKCALWTPASRSETFQTSIPLPVKPQPPPLNTPHHNTPKIDTDATKTCVTVKPVLRRDSCQKKVITARKSCLPSSQKPSIPRKPKSLKQEFKEISCKPSEVSFGTNDGGDVNEGEVGESEDGFSKDEDKYNKS